MFFSTSQKADPSVPLPALVDDGSLEWDEEAAIVVVGLGGAGACVALEAREQGDDVFAVERFRGGGATAISGGIYYAGGGTPIQKEAGIEDSPENMLAYLRHEVRDVVKESTLRAFCEQSVENFRWLQEQGVPFEASLCPFKTSYPNNDYFLYYSGNEGYPPWNQDARPAPRGHRARGKGVSGAAFFAPLRKRVLEEGVRVSWQSTVRRIIKDPGGRVTGVEYHCIRAGSAAAWLHDRLFRLMIFLRYVNIFMLTVSRLIEGCINLLEARATRVRRVRARKGVVLAGGGFVFNKAMVERHAPGHRAGMPLGTIADNGLAIRLGQAAGGATAHMSRISAWRFINPPAAFARGVLVDQTGRRICNEMLYGDTIGAGLFRNGSGKGYLIIDQPLWWQAFRQLRGNLWFQTMGGVLYLFAERKKSGDLMSLARKVGIPGETLRETVAAYNQIALEEAPDPLGKPAGYHSPLRKPPFYALDVSFDARLVPCPSLTLGGLQVDEDSGLVLDEQGAAVPGLYSAGRNAVGVSSWGYVSGLSIADCVFSARRAARHAHRYGGRPAH